jgi:hypothetical protein
VILKQEVHNKTPYRLQCLQNWVLAMIARFIRFLGALFPLDILLKVLPVFTIIAGLILFATSYWVFPQATYPTGHEATKALGQAILVSGVVGCLLSSMRYIGIFQDAVHDVVYGVVHLKTRTDIPDVWSRVTSIICQDKFPTLTQQLYPSILKNYLPSDKNFIYSAFNRECVLDWADKANNIVSWTEHLEIILTPSSKEESINYKYTCRTDSRTPRDLAKIHVDLLRINNTTYEHDNIVKEEDYDDELEKKGLRSSYAISLTGDAEYKINRVLKRKICLAHDPVMEYGSIQFICAATVKVRSETPDLRAVFVSVGNEQFEDKRFGPTYSIHKELKGALIPNQGYIIFIQRV